MESTPNMPVHEGSTNDSLFACAEHERPSSAPADPEDSVALSGLTIIDRSIPDVAQELVHAAAAGERRDVFFVNAHCVNVAAGDSNYRSLLQQSPGVFADGIGMALGARICGRRLRYNVNGTDLLPELCRMAAGAGVPIALLGARPGVAENCRRRLMDTFPGLEITSCHHGFLTPSEDDRAIDEINRSNARILLVAKGVPAQENWIAANRGSLDIPVVMGVGALFDFYSGTVPRAPLWLRRLRLEWCYRLAREPRRMFGRYVLGNPLFICRMIALRLGVGALARENH